MRIWLYKYINDNAILLGTVRNGIKGSVEVSFLYRNGDMSSIPEVTTLIPRVKNDL